MPEADTPLLWHLKVSPYNEKVRWALDHKRIAHARRAMVPLTHHRVARKLSGGTTFPILVIDGRAIADSTAIIEALERRHPERPLYPADAEARRRALALEDHFDEHLGPHTRVLLLHHIMRDPDAMLGGFAPDLGRLRRAVARARFARLRAVVVAGFGIDDDRVAAAFEAVRAAGERFRRELGPSGYLVGDSLTVADVTLASMVAPVAAPQQFPYPQPQRDHPLLAPVRAALSESGLLEWTLDLYARHRAPR
jgi:glutathione S-transferase